MFFSDRSLFSKSNGTIGAQIERPEPHIFMKVQRIQNQIMHWRDAKKWNREEKEKYGIHISNFEKRKEKCRDLFSGSRREREFLQKIIEKSAIFSNFEKRKRNFENKSHDSRGDRDVEISNFSWREREIHLPPFTFLFLFYFSSVLKTKNYLRHRKEFWRPTKVLLLTEVRILLNNTELSS